ncbi:MAG: hypothetical protein ACRD1U_06765 [Vicinamibacterales bacterium]
MGNPARLGIMRLNAARLGTFQPRYRVFVNGVDRTGGGPALNVGVRIASATITHALNHEPDVAAFRCAGFEPLAGQSVAIYLGAEDLGHQLFGGRIIAADILYEGEIPANIAFDCNCIDPTWLLNRQLVLQKYQNQSATTILKNIVAQATIGVTTVHVELNLPTIDEITFTNEEVSDAITRVMERIGGYWFLDYDGDLHAFLATNEFAGPITQAAPRTAAGFVKFEDLSQVVTKVIGIGGGSNAATNVDPGMTMLPIEEAAWYSASGGLVECRPQTITYTGRVAAGVTSSKVAGLPLVPPTPGTLFQAGTALGAGTWSWRYTWATRDGESLDSSSSGSTLDEGDGLKDVLVHSIQPGPPGTVARHIYRLKGFSGVYRRIATINDNTTTTYLDQIPEASISGTPLGTVSTFGPQAGSVVLPVTETAVFAASGGWVDAGMPVRFTGRSVASGPGDLTGIPATGVGAITAGIPVGLEVQHQAHLTGIPTSGPGAIASAIKQGDPVNIRVEITDTAARDALAARLGTGNVLDGIVAATVSDGRFGLSELTAHVQATLAARKDIQESVTFTSRDPTLQVGRLVSIALTEPAIAGTYRVQRIVFSELAITGGLNTVFPLRTVECSNKRYSFDDLLRRLAKLGG